MTSLPPEPRTLANRRPALSCPSHHLDLVAARLDDLATACLALIDGTETDGPWFFLSAVAATIESPSGRPDLADWRSPEGTAYALARLALGRCFREWTTARGLRLDRPALGALRALAEARAARLPAGRVKATRVERPQWTATPLPYLRAALVAAYRRFAEIREGRIDPGGPVPNWAEETAGIARAVACRDAVSIEVGGISFNAKVDDATGLLRFDAASPDPHGESP